MSKKDKLATVGEIARRFKVEVHHIEYLIHSRAIEPVARAGAARIFSEDQVAQLGRELQKVAARRVGGIES